MDVINAEKLFSMKYCYKKSQLFLYNLTLLHSLLIFFFTFWLSSQSLRFPPDDALSSIVKLVVTLPSFFGPRCLFVVVNVIVVYIVGEQKLAGAKSSSVNGILYDEYCVERTEEERNTSGGENGSRLVENVVELEREEDVVGTVVGDDGVVGSEKEKKKEDEESCGLGSGNEELKKRAEAFIARVNKQRKLEDVDCFQL